MYTILYCIRRIVICVLQVAANNARPVRHVRFAALQLRSGAAGPAVAGRALCSGERLFTKNLLDDATFLFLLLVAY